MWTLVFLIFISGELESHVVGSYETMYECFSQREVLSFDLGSSDGYFPLDTQAICVQRDVDSV